MCHKPAMNRQRTKTMTTVASHDHSQWSNVETDGRELDQNSARKTSRLSRRKQMKANTAASVLEVKSNVGPQLLQADTETADDVDKDSEPKPLRRSSANSKRHSQKSRKLLTKVQSQNRYEEVQEESLNKASKVVDTGSEPKPVRRSPRIQEQLKQQETQSEKSRNKTSEAHFLRQGLSQGRAHLLSSQHVDSTGTSATKESNDENLLQPKLTQRNLMSQEQQKKLVEKCLNQKAKVSIPKVDRCLSLSLQQTDGTHSSTFESRKELSKPFKLKSTQRRLRARGQMNEPTEKSRDVKHAKKLHVSRREQGEFTDIQQEDETSEPVTTGNRTCSPTTDCSAQNGIPESGSNVNAIKHMAGHLQSSTGSVLPTFEPMVGDGDEGIMSSQTHSLSVLSSQSQEMTNSDADVQKEILSNQSLAATKVSTVDNSQCCAGVGNVEEHGSNTAVINVSSYANIGVQHVGTVERASRSIPGSTVSASETGTVTSLSSGCSGLAAASRPQEHKSSIPGSFDLLSEVMTSSCTEISHASNMGVYATKTMTTEPAAHSTRASEGMQRMDRVLASIAVALNDEEDNCLPYTDSRFRENISQHKITSQNSVKTMTTEPAAHSTRASEGMQRMDRVLSSIAVALNDEEDNCLSNTDSRFRENISQRNITSQNSVNSSQERVHTSLPPVDSSYQSQMYSHKSMLHTVPCGSAAVQDISCTANEHTYEREDPVADYTASSQSVAPQQQQPRRQKCSDAVASESADCFLSYVFAPKASTVCQMQQQFVGPQDDDYTVSEVNEIPSSFPQSQRHSQKSSQPVSSSQLRRQKCSIAVASQYADSFQSHGRAQNAHIVGPQDDDYTVSEVNEIPSSFPQSQRHSQKSSQPVSSPQLRRQKCSIAVASQYADSFQSHGRAQNASNIYQTQQHIVQKVVECDDYSSSEVNEIPSSVPPTHFQRYSQKEIMQVGSNVARTESGPVVLLCSQAIEAASAAVATKSQLSFPDIDSHGNLTSHHQSLLATGNNRSRRDADGDDGRTVSEAYDGSARDVNVSQSNVQRRVKVSEPLLVHMHPSENECEGNAYDEEIKQGW